MKIDVKKPVTTTEIIEVKCPYYYKDEPETSKRSSSLDWYTYGMITETEHFSIEEHYLKGVVIQVDICRLPWEEEDCKDYYFKEENVKKSTAEEFGAAQKRAFHFLNDVSSK